MGQPAVTPWDPSLLFSASQLLWERGDIVPNYILYLPEAYRPGSLNNAMIQ
jgi:hypothetical protein